MNEEVSVKQLKTNRHAKIKSIIESHKIETQDELAAALRASGIEVTQATVSRDIKELMLIKVPDAAGRYYYAFPKDQPKDQNAMMNSGRLERVLQDSVLNLRAGGNLVVIHSLPGAASSVALALDYMKWPEVLGTVAGDDTIFVALDKPESAEVFIGRFAKK